MALKETNGFVYDKIDAYTGKPVGFKATTKWHNGLAMTDARADGVLYRKAGLKYYVDSDFLEKRIVNVKKFGATGDGVTDDTAAIQLAISTAPAGSIILFPSGNYRTSNTLSVPKTISIQGSGSAYDSSTSITPLAGFPAGASLFNFTNIGRTFIRDISSFMGRLGGNWVTFNGDVANIHIERCHVRQIAAGYWGIEFVNPTGTNGVALSIIRDNFFFDFDGGGIKADVGGDSSQILCNTFQLGNSQGHVLLWNSVVGAGNFTFAQNNASGSAKFIEINGAFNAKVLNNQLEATTPITNAYGAMVAIGGRTSTADPATGGTCYGVTVGDNNMNGHTGNAETAVYFNDSQDSYVLNNHIIGVTNAIKGTALTRRITFLKGFTEGVIVDPNNAVSVYGGSGDNVLQKNLHITGRDVTGVKFGTIDGTGATLDFDPAASVTTASALVRLFRNAVSTGTKFFNIYKGDNTNNIQHSFHSNGDSYVNGLAGNFGIGTAAPGAKLGIRAAAGEFVRMMFSSDATIYHSVKNLFSANVLNNYVIFSLSNGVANTQTDVLSLRGNGSMGVGVLTPEAVIHTKAGTATLPPLKLDTGIDLTTPIAGAVEFSNMRLKFTPEAARRETIAFLSDVQPLVTTGTAVAFDKARIYGDPTPLTSFTASVVGGVFNTVVTVFASGYSARPATLDNSIYKIASEPATYDNTKELMIMFRYISATKVITTITQY